MNVSVPSSSIYLELSRISRSQVGLTDWVVQQDATSRLLGEFSGRPLAHWRDYVGGLPAKPELRDIRASTLTGHTGLGLLGADVLTSGVDDEEFVDVAVRRVEADVLVPWEEGRLELANDLYARLRAIDATVPDLLAGAWDELQRNGPAAVEKAAHCIIEVLDRTLRAAAPDDEVRAWHTRAGRPASEWAGKDRPPHALRVRFLAQGLGGERTVVVAQFESLASFHTSLRDRLQAAKHASQGDLSTVRTLLLSTEYLLMQLFLHRE